MKRRFLIVVALLVALAVAAFATLGFGLTGRAAPAALLNPIFPPGISVAAAPIMAPPKRHRIKLPTLGAVNWIRPAVQPPRTAPQVARCRGDRTGTGKAKPAPCAKSLRNSA
jgi:hypothetical protein